MSFHETDELRHRDAAILASGDAVAAELTGIEPLGNRAWGDVADPGDIAGGEHILGFAHR